ncbi:MAG: hypothetical protein QM784_17035 [Polyangiaceae bacterium]
MRTTARRRNRTRLGGNIVTAQGAGARLDGEVRRHLSATRRRRASNRMHFQTYWIAKTRPSGASASQWQAAPSLQSPLRRTKAAQVIQLVIPMRTVESSFCIASNADNPIGQTPFERLSLDDSRRLPHIRSREGGRNAFSHRLDVTTLMARHSTRKTQSNPRRKRFRNVGTSSSKDVHPLEWSA